MGIIERRLRQKEEVKMDILKAAWELAKKDGWQAVSIRKIADAIEYRSFMITLKTRKLSCLNLQSSALRS